MSSVWFKILASLKNGHIFDATGNLSLSDNIGFNWQQQCTDAANMSCGDSQLVNTVSLPPCHHKPRTLSSLSCVIAVYNVSELELKVICVIGNSTIFLLVASFVMKKNKRYSYDAGYKLKVIASIEEHGTDQHFGPPPTEKNHLRLVAY